ncbi:hypothetical protein CLAFUW4_04061 [Fulvia fulva]|uniref:Uncharacterized protein n=1 Tax=Passalora fulva TaxID=5499 RepID=A0A9Q8LE90_PASFU|nr:uncharacterized protein CLAFUR5_04024 [Fulvia fulva]KAK4626821.1 hypothetical protein CLAFUR4_04047 [Fulvia fulva]KAK4627486.1 hypothetical protein CLAFUR0_04048 [Fulvia fulva]UJO15875.1 hypothetical protein CLAFUR5_04024 [Fulvia fulva]WPV13896.1 hypothetical protein CLAFUW4_04061 [Fulvia fulva]WPV28963.1 hypothetical protein CLAFUW7_04050 [Fulvia fulva]
MGSYHGATAVRRTSTSSKPTLRETIARSKATEQYGRHRSRSAIITTLKTRSSYTLGQRLHATTTLRNLRSSSKLRFERRGHVATDPVRKAISSFRKGKLRWNKKQLAALKHWHEWLPQWHQRHQQLPYMQEGLRLLGEVFFLGRLSRCNFDWQDDLYKDERRYGMTCSPDSGSRNWISIRVDPKARYSERTSTRDSVIMTILHELAHGFPDIWACDGSKCKIASCRIIHARGIGSTGHGYLWVQLVSHMYAVVQRVFNINTVDAASHTLSGMICEWMEIGYVPDWRHLRGCHRRFRSHIAGIIREYKDKAWAPSPAIEEEEG